MGHNATRETLLMRWAQLCNETFWDDIPAKVELNGYGVIEMSPASNRHGMRQAAVGNALAQQYPKGTVVIECSVLTTDGIRVPDVAWASAAFMARHGEVTPFPQAPEICVEVRSPSNTNAEMAHKTELFLQAGAVEVWIVGEGGGMQVFDADGEKPVSRYGFTLPEAG